MIVTLGILALVVSAFGFGSAARMLYVNVREKEDEFFLWALPIGNAFIGTLMLVLAIFIFTEF